MTAATTTTTTTTDFAADWQAWHEAHEKNRADAHGFLAITSINWLTDEPQTFDDAPGTWTTGADGTAGIVVDLGDETVTIDGATVTGRHEFGVIPERGGVDVHWRDAVLEVAKRGGADILRPRHPSAPVLAAYQGTGAYPARPEWAVEATYVPYAEPRPTTVGSVVDELAHVYDAPGEIRFRLADGEHSLTVFPGSAPGALLVLFTDATSGVTTYAANRSLSLGAPNSDGTLVVDFNRAVNLPCAYTSFATCPLPPENNRLTVPIEAGELAPAS